MQLQTIQEKIMKATLTTTTDTFNTSKNLPTPLDFDNCFVIAKENHAYRRKLIEGMFIERNKEKRVNVNSGSQPNTCWKPLLTLLPELDLEYHLEKTSNQHQQNPDNF